MVLSESIFKQFFYNSSLLILNLILRGITSIVLLRIYNDRNDRFGTYGLDRSPFAGTGIRDAFGGGGRSMPNNGYQDLDSQVPTSIVTGSPLSGQTPAAAATQSANVPYQSVPSPIHSSLIDTK